MPRTAAIKPTPKGLALLGVLAGIGFIVCVGVYILGSNTLHKATAELRGREKQVAESKRIAERLEQAEDRYAFALAQVSFLEHSVSTRDFIPTLLKQLEQLGKSVDLKVLSVRPRMETSQPTRRRRDPAAEVEGGQGQEKGKSANGASEKSNPYDSLTIDIEVEGTYANLMSFLYRITSFPKVLEVNTIQISPTSQPKTRGSPDLSMQINVSAYVFPADQGSGGMPEVRPPEGELRTTSRPGQGTGSDA